MALNIPSRYESRIEQIALAHHISKGEVLDRVLEAGLERFATMSERPHRSYASFFGIAKGRPGSHNSPEAVDAYIEDLRSEW